MTPPRKTKSSTSSSNVSWILFAESALEGGLLRAHRRVKQSKPKVDLKALFRREVSKLFNSHRTTVVSRAERIYQDGRQEIIHLEQVDDGEGEGNMCVTKLEGISEDFPAGSQCSQRRVASSSISRVISNGNRNDAAKTEAEQSQALVRASRKAGRVTRASSSRLRGLDELNEKLESLDVVSNLSGLSKALRGPHGGLSRWVLLADVQYWAGFRLRDARLDCVVALSRQCTRRIDFPIAILNSLSLLLDLCIPTP
jgi:hypothetical protein